MADNDSAWDVGVGNALGAGRTGDSIFPSGPFPQDNPPNGHDNAVTDDHAHLDEPPPDDNGHLMTDNGTDGGVPLPPTTRMRSNHQLSAQEKKERQKQQNRRAAERSRNKKREELTALEMTVNNIQEENNRLRARLSTLLANKSTDTTQAQQDEDAPPSGGIDYANLVKLQAELASAKATLLERELELARQQEKDGQGGDNTELRQVLLTHTTSLHAVQSEVKTLHMLIAHLRTERDNLSRQRDTLAREIEARRTLRNTAGETPTPALNSRASGSERALLELRGIVDGAIKSWEQNSMLPPRNVDGNP